MSDLHELLKTYVENGTVPGAVGLVSRGDRVEVAAVGAVDVDGTAEMRRDTVFRVASLTKPVVAAAVLTLVDDGVIGLDDPVGRWLPELAEPSVLRTPSGPLDDVVPAERSITVLDLLTSCSGHGFPSDYSFPGGQALMRLHRGGLSPRDCPAPDAWMAELGRIPLLYQPGTAWLYNTSSDVQGVLIERVAGRSLAGFLAERIFEPLGMADTGFTVPKEKLGRFTTFYRPTEQGGLESADGPEGQWSGPLAFHSGAGGLVSTVDDWSTFARMLLAGGVADGGRRVLTQESVRLMTTDRLTAAQRAGSALFLEGQSWGFGGSVDIEAVSPWNVPGRYGWVGGSGTTGHLTPSTRTIAVLFTQVAMTGPTPPTMMRDFWRYAAGARGEGSGA